VKFFFAQRIKKMLRKHEIEPSIVAFDDKELRKEGIEK
jgi:hypothetical protein